MFPPPHHTLFRCKIRNYSSWSLLKHKVILKPMLLSSSKTTLEEVHRNPICWPSTERPVVGLDLWHTTRKVKRPWASKTAKMTERKYWSFAMRSWFQVMNDDYPDRCIRRLPQNNVGGRNIKTFSMLQVILLRQQAKSHEAGYILICLLIAWSTKVRYLRVYICLIQPYRHNIRDWSIESCLTHRLNESRCVLR